LEEGARVQVAHRGILGSSDPIAITVGRMTVAVRRVHAAAMEVEAL
jgi:ferrous iron transport protein A